MIEFLRTSLKSLVFSTAKKKTVYALEDIPSTWKIMPDDEKTLWKKAIDDPDTSVKAIYFQALEDVENQLHYHEYVEHIIVLKGKVKIETAKQCFDLTDGDDLTIPSNIAHYSKTQKGTIQLVIWHPITDEKLITEIV